jgi:bifunctional ADP-heptose synthase (sugar kinase/adenylyltransferase)
MRIINNKIEKIYLNKIKKKYSLNYINNLFFKIKKIKVCLIGDPIIDKYTFCSVRGISSKSPTLASKFVNEDIHAGGSFAVAMMLAKLGARVDLIYYSDQSKITKLIEKNLSKKINLLPVLTGVSKNKVNIINRIVNLPKYEKLHQMYFNCNYRHTQKSIVDLKKKINQFYHKNDLTLVIDFGYNFFNKDIINFLDDFNFSLNVHKNSVNHYYNYPSKFLKKNKYLTLNLNEYCNDKRLDLADRNIESIKKFIKENNDNDNFSLTLGDQGSIIKKNNKITYCPAFYSGLIDTTGSGDAFFSMTSILNKLNCNLDLTLFIGNIYAAMHGNYFGNKTFITTAMIKKQIKSMLT